MNTTDKLRILLVDDHLVVRMGLATMLAIEEGLSVVGEASDGLEAVELVRKLRPDVVIMDVMMPKMDGVEATRTIRQDCPETKILLLTTYSSAKELKSALDAGAHGAMLKEASKKELITAIRKVAAGDRVICDTIAANIRETHSAPKLTPRQLEILTCVAKGFGNREISSMLNIGFENVKAQLKTVYLILNANSRAEAASTAISLGLIQP